MRTAPESGSVALRSPTVSPAGRFSNMDRTVEVFKSAGGELLAFAEKKERQRQAISLKLQILRNSSKGKANFYSRLWLEKSIDIKRKVTFPWHKVYRRSLCVNFGMAPEEWMLWGIRQRVSADRPACVVVEDGFSVPRGH